jgi:hypothetical protein
MTRAAARRKRWRRWVATGFGLVIAAMGSFCLFLWLSLTHVPTWYHPPTVPEAEYQRVRDSLVDAVSEFSDRMVRGKPFEITVTGRQVSEWIATRSEIWPDAGDWIPPFLQDPMMAFEPGRMILAARLNKNDWKAIVSAHLTFVATPETVTIRLTEVAGGSLSIPVSLVAERLQSVLAASGQDVGAMPDGVSDAVRLFRDHGAAELLQRGVAVENRFRWENGERWFRILAVVIERGTLRLRVEPLPTGRAPGDVRRGLP